MQCTYQYIYCFSLFAYFGGTLRCCAIHVLCVHVYAQVVLLSSMCLSLFMVFYCSSWSCTTGGFCCSVLCINTVHPNVTTRVPRLHGRGSVNFNHCCAVRCFCCSGHAPVFGIFFFVDSSIDIRHRGMCICRTYDKY